MPQTACRNSNWFEFYDCLKIYQNGPRTSIFSFSRHFSSQDFYPFSLSDLLETLHTCSPHHYLGSVFFIFSGFQNILKKKGFIFQKIIVFLGRSDLPICRSLMHKECYKHGVFIAAVWHYVENNSRLALGFNPCFLGAMGFDLGALFFINDFEVWRGELFLSRQAF